jgi:hypothetical protein
VEKLAVLLPRESERSIACIIKSPEKIIKFSDLARDFGDKIAA